MTLSVRYVAPPRGGWAHPAGSFARGSRDYCHALATAGYHVWIDSECPQDAEVYRSSQNLSDEVRAAEIFAHPIDKPDVLIVSAFGISTDQFDEKKIAQLTPPGHRYMARILQTTYETTRPSDHVLENLHRWDAVFVPSRWNAVCLRAAGLPHVYAIPHVVAAHYWPLRQSRETSPPKTPARTFGWIGTWEPRKAGEVAVRAFVKAFEPGEAKLIIKCNKSDWRPYAPPFEQVNMITAQTKGWREADWRPHIEIRDSIVTREQLFKLYEEIDVFVSTSHGEGFCLPGMEAKLAGRRVVATDSGGVNEFMTRSDILVPGKLGLCPWARMYGWPEDSSWYHHDVEEVASALRACTMMPRPAPWDWSPLSLGFIAEELDEMIEETVKRVSS